MPPQRRKTGPGGPPRRRPKIAGASRARQVPPIEAEAEARTEGVDFEKSPESAAPASGPAPEDRVHDTPNEQPSQTVSPERERTEPQDATDWDGTDADGTGDEGAVVPAERPSNGWKPVVLIGAAAVVLAVIAAVAALRPGAEISNRAWVDDGATREVTEAAQHAIETMHGYNFETIDEDFAQIRELLNEERRAEFDSTAEVTKQAAVQTRTVTEVDVLHIGASMLDDTRAEVAAYINVSATGDGIAQGSAAAPLLVRMEKTDGKWLVSEIRDQ